MPGIPCSAEGERLRKPQSSALEDSTVRKMSIAATTKIAAKLSSLAPSDPFLKLIVKSLLWRF
jgi:hypothetical protein